MNLPIITLCCHVNTVFAPTAHDRGDSYNTPTMVHTPCVLGSPDSQSSAASDSFTANLMLSASQGHACPGVILADILYGTRGCCTGRAACVMPSHAVPRQAANQWSKLQQHVAKQNPMPWSLPSGRACSPYSKQQSCQAVHSGQKTCSVAHIQTTCSRSQCRCAGVHI